MNRFVDADGFCYPIVAARAELLNHLAADLDRNVRDGPVRVCRRMHSEFQIALPFDRRKVDDRALFGPPQTLNGRAFKPIPAWAEELILIKRGRFCPGSWRPL